MTVKLKNATVPLLDINTTNRKLNCKEKTMDIKNIDNKQQYRTTKRDEYATNAEENKVSQLNVTENVKHIYENDVLRGIEIREKTYHPPQEL